MVIIVVVILVAGGALVSLAPRLLDWASDFINTGIGGGNEAQLAWFIELPDGTTEDIDPNTFSVLFAGKEIRYIGFKTQIKLSYTGDISAIKYNVEMTMSFDGVPKQTGSSGEQTMTEVGASGEWFDLFGAGISFSSTTIEGWDGIGNHELGAEVTISLTVYTTVQGQTKQQSVSGTASGTTTIQIVKDEVTMDISVNVVAISVFPTPLG